MEEQQSPVLGHPEASHNQSTEETSIEGDNPADKPKGRFLFQPGNKFGKGGFRPNSGRKPITFQQRRDMFDLQLTEKLPKILERLTKLALGPNDDLALKAAALILKHALPPAVNPKETAAPGITVNITNPANLLEAQSELDRIRKSRQNVIEIESKTDSNQT